ncbi:MAG: hypothetical protein IID40_10940 [Planctomycetes bacterium]|nr:hypothetical protein [Planctomycetota bacterium]
MKLWLLFVVLTLVCWGCYVPMLHQGQSAFGGKSSALKAFLFVGLAYFLVSLGVLGYLMWAQAEPLEFARRGMSLSTLAGFLGAAGALGIVFALKYGGKPIFVAPLVFSGAPIVNTLVTMAWHKPAKPPGILFFAGILLVGLGAGLVLRFKPS